MMAWCWSILCVAILGMPAASLQVPIPTTPIMGIGALLFKPRGMQIQPSRGDDDTLTEAGVFFTDAFWSGKVAAAAKREGFFLGKNGGGVLTPMQSATIERQQVAEFRRRYRQKSSPISTKAGTVEGSELLVCRNGQGRVMGCVGIEVDSIRLNTPNQPYSTRAPLMSNLAVGRDFRRRGVAEELVGRAEDLARREWGFNTCYLYVEKDNRPAVRLYQKLGYRKDWEDDSATTMIPTPSGKLRTTPTVLVCMKKRLDVPAFFAQFLS